MLDQVSLEDHLRDDGYVLLKQIFAMDEMREVAARLAEGMAVAGESSALKSRGKTYGSRNLLQSFPEVAELIRRPALCDFGARILGSHAGIVRVLFFDKPPERSWSLPWHRDRTIAVRRNDLVSEHFAKPTRKAGVPHVEASSAILSEMLTLRVHLDPMTEQNGPLSVMPGSHLEENATPQSPVRVLADAGDVLAMRPLLSHCSGLSEPGTIAHRRVIHFELAARRGLPDQYEWHSYLPLFESG